MENARHARRAFPESGLKANLQFIKPRFAQKSLPWSNVKRVVQRPEGPRVSSHAREGVVTGKSLPRPKGPTLTSHFCRRFAPQVSNWSIIHALTDVAIN